MLSFVSPSKLLSSIIIPLWVLSNFPAPVSAVDERHTNCSAPFSCSNQIDLRYPFWKPGRSEYCGHPDFELDCSGDSAEINITSVTYMILDVNQSSNTLKLVRKDYIDTLCPSNPLNTTLNSFFAFANDTTLVRLFYDCPPPSTGVNPPSLGYVGDIDCGEDDGKRDYYVARNLSSPLPDNENYLISNAFAACRTNVSVPASESELSAVENGRENLQAALGGGFELKWDLPNDTCNECIESGGVCGFNGTLSRFTCYCADKPYDSTCIKGVSSAAIIGISVACGAVAVILIVGGLFLCFLRRRKKTTAQYRSTDFIYCRSLKEAKSFQYTSNCRNFEAFQYTSNCRNFEAFITLRQFSYAEVKKMSKSFTEVLGKGGFGTVYRGKLPDGRLVAVKVLNESKGNGEEFVNEVASMSNTSHVNIVSLLGFCFEGTKRALIYEFVPNGSLDKYISNNNLSKMEWRTLYEIAVGVARGLEYLHNGCKTRIVHFDIKPQNILLDEHLCPKISDFGLAKLCEKRESIMSILDARGTFGYIAPEVFSRGYGRVSHKSDVYSYGMLVLEMVGARENDKAETSTTNGSSMYFPDWIYKDLERGRDVELLGDEVTEEEKETAKKMILVGLWCIQTNPSDRPRMSRVVKMMEGSLDALQIPPKPLLFCPMELPQVCSNPTKDNSNFTEPSQESFCE